ncbi:pentapeptide repeat-containing protein [uncultured Rothia sp.]|uniref:pentapeptide repeat-containing protein n=1 Tax=uncultured Rothia sp. TaxID=316088 RepID=UPI0028D30801|nr:pentapeptide repeat-containing protein [uncultured Rothia sp.]
MTKLLDNREDTSRSNSPLWKRVIAWGGKNWFYITLSLLAVIVVPCAFFIPPHIPGLKDDGNTVVSVRQSILAVLAGALTMLTLWETHRKNTHERDKNERDHIRQVKAERRSRYAKAIEQLADDKSAVRLGGIYTLVKLADEWLTDSKTTPDETDRIAEGQIIINSLCAYIQSPYSLAEKRIFIEDIETFEESGDKFTNERGALYMEQKIRQVIFNEISKRSSKCNDSNEIKPGKWSVFEFNFTRSPIFYSLNDINLENANFSNSIFYGITNFCGSKFYGGTNFTGVSFEENANFLDVTFQNGVDFTEAFFKKDADFSNATFIEDAIFDSTVFDSSIFQVNYASFHGAKFHGNTSFYKSVFNAQTHFNKATFHKGVNFDNSCFEESPEFVNEKNIKESDSAGFSYKADPNYYSFRIDYSYPGSFDTIQINAPGGISFRVPEGCILFDPNSWDEENQKYTIKIKPTPPLNMQYIIFYRMNTTFP